MGIGIIAWVLRTKYQPAKVGSYTERGAGAVVFDEGGGGGGENSAKNGGARVGIT